MIAHAGNNTPGAIRLQPFYLSGAAGRLHATLFAASQSGIKPALLVLAPFAEEMNKSRPMLAACARRIAASGVDVLLFDPFGTGDSEGEFAEATFERWQSDVRTAYQFLTERGNAPIHVLAMRTGALLIPALESNATQKAQAKLILWQPVLKGADYWRQFLRLRVAAAALRESTGEANALSPQDILQRDGAIEIAGYTVSQELVRGLTAAQFDVHSAAQYARVSWLEVALASASGAAPVPSMPAQRTVDDWRKTLPSVELAAVSGEQFWTTSEISYAPLLIEASARSLSAA